MIAWCRTNQPPQGPSFVTTAHATVANKPHAATSLVIHYRFTSPLHLSHILIVLLALQIYPRNSEFRAWEHSSVTECCFDELLCFNLLNDHRIPFNDLHDEQRAAVLTHLSNGKYVSARFTPLCKLPACDILFTTHLPHPRCSLLPAAHPGGSIDPQSFSLL